MTSLLRRPLASTLALAFALPLLTGVAQAAPLQVRSLTLKPGPDAGEPNAVASGWADGSVKMPFIDGTGPVATRINDALFLAAMGTPAPVKPGATFTPPARDLPEGTASQDFEVNRNDARLLVITLNAEGCGAYCEGYDTVYNFDARNGWAVTLHDLLQPGALNPLGQRLQKEVRKRYADQLKTLRTELAAARKRKPKAPADEINDLQERIELNEGCLADESGTRSAAQTVRYARLNLTGPGLGLHLGRCSNHALRALDDVAEINITLPPADVRPLLNAYGRALVLGEGEAGPPAQPFGQVLHGKIGPAAVTLRLDRPLSGGVSGHYFYDRFRQLILLSGTLEGDTLTLTETVDDKTATLRLKVQGTRLQGEWQGGERRLPVSLSW
ncbi:hypothetical protein [Roseateles sp. BYS87W]|uniref:Uncharacterized protein n=1 Tax=Pelomonas baiyunensis TaxID=3299026 RepID=A0ABW7GYT1_9BURK